MSRHLKFYLSSLVVAIALVIGATWIITSETGLRLLAREAVHFTHGQLKIGTIHGSLIDTIKAQNLSFNDKNFHFKLDTITLSWEPKALFRGKLHIVNLSADKLSANFEKASHETQRLLPFAHKKPRKILNPFPYLKIDNLHVTNVTIQHNSLPKPIVIKTINLETTPNSKGLHNLKAEILADAFKLKADGIINGHKKLAWHLTIPHIQKLIANHRGTLSDNGNLTLDHNKLLLNNKLNLQNYQGPFLACSNLISNLQLDSSNNTPSSLDVSGKNLDWNHYKIANLNWNGDIKFTKNRWQNLSLNLKPLELTTPYKNRIDTITLKTGQIDIQNSKAGIKIDGKIDIVKQQPLTLKLLLPKYHATTWPQKNQKLHGEISWKTSDLTLLSLINSKIKKPTGNLSANLEIDGTLTKPKLIGNLQLKDGHLYLDQLNINPKNINFDATSDGKTLDYTLNAKAGAGTFKAVGKTDLRDKTLPTTINITGDNFLTSNTRTTYLRTSPNLKVTLDTKKIDITGELLIPKARIGSVAHHRGVTTLPADVTFVDQKDKKHPSHPIAINSKIKLIIGKDVRIKMLGFDGQLAGHLEITEAPKKPTTATGIISVKNGTYRTYGQNLKIADNSSLVFANSPLNNPHLNLRMFRTVHTTDHTSTMGVTYMQESKRIVGMHMSGEAKNSKITLYSDPADISNADIFSYLILGQSTAKASEDNTQMLLQAASALALGGGSGELNQVVDQLRKGLGLETIGLEAESTIDPETKQAVSNTALVLGKYIGDKLYVSYSYGLLQPMNIFRVSYFLSKSFTVQTEANSDGQGVDILYHFEKR